MLLNCVSLGLFAKWASKEFTLKLDFHFQTPSLAAQSIPLPSYPIPQKLSCKTYWMVLSNRITYDFFRVYDLSPKPTHHNYLSFFLEEEEARWKGLVNVNSPNPFVCLVFSASSNVDAFWGVLYEYKFSYFVSTPIYPSTFLSPPLLHLQSSSPFLRGP